jgi:hypothetical protein
LSIDKVYNAKNIFCIAISYRKIDQKNTFDFMALKKGPKKVLWDKLFFNVTSLPQQVFFVTQLIVKFWINRMIMIELKKSYTDIKRFIFHLILALRHLLDSRRRMYRTKGHRHDI